MPAPIPPPPPQPSLAETRRAVRLLRWLCLVLVAVYAAWASHYHPDMEMVRYGRYHAQSWMLWKVRQLDENTLRSHDGGRIVWLIGSSILRDAFNQPMVNRELAERGSPWRVAKFGMNRGASGLSAGLAEKLPLRAGDRVLHSISPDNFREDWLEKVGLPEDRLMMILPADAIWQIAEWPFQKKLEVAFSRPLDFHRYHDEYIRGTRELAEALWWWRRPRKAKPGYHTRFNRTREMKWMDRALERLESSAEWFDADEIDYSPEQFNMAGLAILQQHCASLGVEFSLIDLPHREVYYSQLLAPEILSAWLDWSSGQDLYAFPRLPDDFFYDFKHPNSSGRQLLTAHLIDWLAPTSSELIAPSSGH